MVTLQGIYSIGDTRVYNSSGMILTGESEVLGKKPVTMLMCKLAIPYVIAAGTPR
jgi:hypothetical protein